MQLGTFTPTSVDGNKSTLAGYERIYIDHDASSFKSSSAYSSFLGGHTSDQLEAIPLGLIRKREMWPKRDGTQSSADGTKIARRGKQCMSVDGETGYPQVSFPWEDYRESGTSRVSSHAMYRPKTLQCSSCPFRKWSKDGKTGPSCQPRWYIPIMNKYTFESLRRGEPIGVSVLELTQSGITTFKDAYKNEVGVDEFLFFYKFHMSLTVVRRNNKQFARPNFAVSVNEHPELKPIYVKYLREVKEKLTDASNLTAMGGSAKISALTPRS